VVEEVAKETYGGVFIPKSVISKWIMWIVTLTIITLWAVTASGQYPRHVSSLVSKVLLSLLHKSLGLPPLSIPLFTLYFSTWGDHQNRKGNSKWTCLRKL
jgi:preprotein translocase subunit Sec63